MSHQIFNQTIEDGKDPVDDGDINDDDDDTDVDEDNEHTNTKH